jgi:Zn-dependent M28 family amino/carboxypeptidase
MHRSEKLIFTLLAALPCLAQFSGARALEATRQVVEFGPRPPGSAAAKKMHAFIESELRKLGWQLQPDEFTTRTPKGVVPMKNIIALKPGQSGRAVAITGHMDTKIFPFRFVGANDAGASTGLLLEMARALKDLPLKNSVYLIFFDGEEAFGEWSPVDSLYGSRHLAERWARDGTAGKLSALINVDMIGDRDLHIVQEYFSYEPLQKLVWQVARELGYSKHFSDERIPIEDDHVPFLRKGVRALDLIDFEYGPSHSWWHTSEDTMDKLSAQSLEAVGRVLVETLKRLD